MISGCGNQLIKFLLFGVNFLLFLFGGIVFGVSLWATLDKNFLDHLEEFAQKMKLDEALVEELSKVGSRICFESGLSVKMSSE